METVLHYRGLDIVVDDLERGYFEAAADGRLVVQACDGCSVARYPPGQRCLACGSAHWHWRETSGKGRLSACVVVEHSVREAFPAPYAVALVELDDLAAGSDPAHAVRILSTILEADGATSVRDALPDGTPVEVCFQPLAEGYALPEFKLTAGSNNLRERMPPSAPN